MAVVNVKRGPPYFSRSRGPGGSSLEVMPRPRLCECEDLLCLVNLNRSSSDPLCLLMQLISSPIATHNQHQSATAGVWERFSPREGESCWCWYWIQTVLTLRLQKDVSLIHREDDKHILNFFLIIIYVPSWRGLGFAGL